MGFIVVFLALCDLIEVPSKSRRKNSRILKKHIICRRIFNVLLQEFLEKSIEFGKSVKELKDCFGADSKTSEDCNICA